MAKYVDGFVLVIPKKKTKEYTKMAQEGRDMWLKLGALEYFECLGNDLKTKDMGGGKPLTFTQMAKAKTTENVWFSFIVFKSKAHRDTVNKKVMEGMEKYKEKYKDFTMPFDVKRMAYGGFEVIVEG